ncbi:nicotinamide riboside transporter PnuC [Kineosporia babensis]|uniref:Nicotinamide riboside transporter PnuC n=1 Tax=Kineosporia babensis TaxID=499548 RepID=A0A9X1SZL6_9ACTN|nr:nicotinamide riboside transporter PnuC [Kineosporia babensis]MCD5312073.1 nicotinamide riboside transporter PnuC [Kineosporia babensis]
MDWLNDVVAPLNQALFELNGHAVTWAELLGFVSGGLCVWLTMRASVLNFPVGIVNCALFLVLFMSARLWAGAGLQIVFIVLGAIGWWQWRRGQVADVPVRTASPLLLAGCLAAVVVGTAGLTVLLRAADDVSPFWDALTTALALAAQWLLNTRRIATWYFWIAADCIYVPLYASQGLYLTAVIYVLFLGLCLNGLRLWRSSAAGTNATPSTVAA